LATFPDTNALPDFYIKLMRLTLEFTDFKKSLGAINWAIKKISRFQKTYVSKIIKSKDRDMVKNLSKQFYGRISSVLKQIESNLSYLELCRKIMRSYPDIKDMFTVCIYGFPNVGKSTLLNKMTNTKAEVAAYAFTTKSINVGYLETKDEKIQVIDVPGTLARADRRNDIEMQAELVMKELSNIVVYVFDLSIYCGYSIEKQIELYHKLGEKKKVLIYLSKTDLIDSEIVDNFDYKHYSLEEIKEKIVELAK